MTPQQTQQPPIEVLETRIISQTDYCHCWPTVTRLKNGTLMAVYSGGRAHHICPFGRVEMIASVDEGKTWSWPRVILDSELDDRDAGILETAQGTLLVTTFSSLYYRLHFQSDNPDWQAAERRSVTGKGESQIGGWLVRSTDGGKSWSSRIPVPCSAPHGPIQTAAGRILYFGKEYGVEDANLTDMGSIGVWETLDEGLTWQLLSKIPLREKDSANLYFELHGVEAADGTLIAHIRYHGQQDVVGSGYCAGQTTYQSESADGGKTWTTPHEIGLWHGIPSHLLRLRNGELLMTYGYRETPLGIRVRFSRDGGKNWPEEKVIVDDVADNVDVGYPSTVELAKGDFLTLWYEGSIPWGNRPESPQGANKFGKLRQAIWRQSVS